MTQRLNAWGRREAFDAFEMGAVDPPGSLIARVARVRRWRVARRLAAGSAALALAAWGGWELVRGTVAPTPPIAPAIARQAGSPAAAPDTASSSFDQNAQGAMSALAWHRADLNRSAASLILPWPMTKSSTPLPTMPPMTGRRVPMPPPR